MRSESCSEPSSTSVQSCSVLSFDMINNVDFSTKVWSISTVLSSCHFLWAHSKTKLTKGCGLTISTSSLEDCNTSTQNRGKAKNSRLLCSCSKSVAAMCSSTQLICKSIATIVVRILNSLNSFLASTKR